MSDKYSYSDLLGKEVEVEFVNGKSVVGTLKSIEEGSTITLIGDGTPDNLTLGAMNQDYVDGERRLNMSNITSVSLWQGFN
ncbi:hypothetical protein [Haloferax sp. Atlit-4N]|uniref:hypothetical protein n=1 Tax=Haloferax sp. Atlit-4N TaxID=2077206 RepID=UPI0011C064AD|nr:hypothetical protein [Haloferax sp. Atlit-4N]